MSNVVELPGIKRHVTPALREVLFETLRHNANTPRHAPTVMVHQRVREGQVLYAPINPLAMAFARIARRLDGLLTAEQVEIMRADMGLNIEFVARRS